MQLKLSSKYLYQAAEHPVAVHVQPPVVFWLCECEGANGGGARRGGPRRAGVGAVRGPGSISGNCSGKDSTIQGGWAMAVCAVRWQRRGEGVGGNGTEGVVSADVSGICSHAASACAVRASLIQVKCV